MEPFELHCRVITSEEGKFSFQIFNPITGIVPFSCSVWYDTKAEAIKESEALRTGFISSMLSKGVIVEMPPEGSPATLFLRVPTGQPVVEAVQAAMQRKREPQLILCAMAVSKSTGKYGFCMCTDHGDVLIEPEEWFDTPEDAYKNGTTKIQEFKKKIQELAAKHGFGDVQFIEPEEQDTVHAQARQNAEQVAQQITPPISTESPPQVTPAETKKPWRPFAKVPETFTPTLN